VGRNSGLVTRTSKEATWPGSVVTSCHCWEKTRISNRLKVVCAFNLEWPCLPKFKRGLPPYPEPPKWISGQGSSSIHCLQNKRSLQGTPNANWGPIAFSAISVPKRMGHSAEMLQTAPTLRPIQCGWSRREKTSTKHILRGCPKFFQIW